MKARHRRLVMALLGIGVLALGQPAAATPIPVHIDRFLVEKNGATFFDDDFTDGIAPPSGTGGFSYAVQGTPTESGGRVRLDPVGSITSPGAGFDAGMTVNVEGAILLSNIDPTNTTAGLKSITRFRSRASSTSSCRVPGICTASASPTSARRTATTSSVSSSGHPARRRSRGSSLPARWGRR